MLTRILVHTNALLYVLVQFLLVCFLFSVLNSTHACAVFVALHYTIQLRGRVLRTAVFFFSFLLRRF